MPFFFHDNNYKKKYLGIYIKGVAKMIIKPTDAIGSVKHYEQGVTVRKPEAAYKNSHMQPDEVILSNRGADIANTLKQIREASDVRQEKVDELKKQVESGTYYVNAYDIAANIVAVYKGDLG